MKGLFLQLVGREPLDGTQSLRRADDPHRASPIKPVTIGTTVVLLGLMFVLIGSYTVEAEEAKSAKPTVTDVVFDPANPQTGDKLKVRMKLHHAVRAEVKWSVNGEEAGMSDYDGFADGVEFSGTLKTGDKITAKVTPFNDMGEAGATVEKQVRCTKAPPTLKLVSQKVAGTVYKAKVDVSDPDKGSVTLTVEGPKGMQIDNDGNISWEMGKTKSGKWPIKVVGKDSAGAKVILTWTLRIHTEEER